MKKFLLVFVSVLLSLQVCVLASDDAAVKRIEFIWNIISELELKSSGNKPQFVDLDANDKYYSVAATALEYKILTGYGKNKIKPYDELTFEDAVVFLCRAYKVEQTSSLYLASVKDRTEISGYASGYLSAAIHNGIIRPDDSGRINPKKIITKADMESLIEAFKKYQKTQLNFCQGYPRESESTDFGSFNISLKMTLPCKVYYKLLPADTYLTSYRPEKSEIDKLLTPVSRAYTEVEASVKIDDTKEYIMYLKAVDEKGKIITDIIYGVSAHPYHAGEGTKTNPYLIYNREQLMGMKYYPDSYFRLEADITLSGEWKPIEINTKGRVGFSGELDGNYHKIKNLVINDQRINSGLFREIHGGRIKRLYIDGTVKGGENVGIIAGRSAGGSITECFVTGRVHADLAKGGAFVGVNEGLIENSVAAAYMVEAQSYAGGIAGSNREGEIKNCISAVYSVTAEMYASSIAGINIDGEISSNMCANAYADDIITVKSGRVTTNKQNGKTYNNYCYEKMFSNVDVNFDDMSHDGLEVSWEQMTNPDFYRNTLGWDLKKIWKNTTDYDFRLIYPKGFSGIDMVKGITMYAPIKIENKSELLKVRENIDFHYILTRNISLGDTSWKMIAENGNAEEGFAGTFDGAGHTISGIHIGKKNTGNSYGMFGVISSGTVRNLVLDKLTIEGESLAGGLVAENYGYIENCRVIGKIYGLRKDNMLSLGGICGNNYGIMENVRSDVKIRADGEVLTIGGICANNEGFIDNAEFRGSLNAELNTEYSNAVAGGIAGINMNGVIYNSFAKPQIVARASTNYAGSICGIADGGEIYKTSATGKIVVNSKAYEGATGYIGGIAGLAPRGLIMNSASAVEIEADTNTAYAGGILGYGIEPTIQNNYSVSKLSVTGGNFSPDALCNVGGICGFAEGGFINDNVSADKLLSSSGLVANIANSYGDTVAYSNNFSCIDTEMFGVMADVGSNGTKTRFELLTPDFFFKPVSDGGKLGWSEGDVWYRDKKYALPLLWGVPGQNEMKKF